MARRKLEDIQLEILKKIGEVDSLSSLEVLTKDEKQTVNNLTSNSKVSIWRLWVFVQSFVIWVHEGLFEVHKREIEEQIALNKIHTALWYRDECKKFQLGFNLNENGKYNNEGVLEADILKSKIISQASVEELAGRLKIKVAKTNSQKELEPLENSELKAFSNYINLVKDAGTRLEIISRPPDEIKMKLDIYFNPLILDARGHRLDGKNEKPVLEAINNFLYNLEFNGEFLTDKFEEYLRDVEGVELVGVESLQARFGTNIFEDIKETYIADAGYMKLDFLNTEIKYIAREVY